MTTRRFAHVDMDAFYASIEIHDNPSLRGKPVVVGGPSDARGVVAAASYEARVYGVYSAMPMAEAMRRCPHLVRLEARMDRYVDVSERVMDLLQGFSPLVEALSLDEAFLDLSGSERSLGASIDLGRGLKQRMAEVTGLTASIGIAPVKFVAKIASDLEKPDGLVTVEPGEVESFLAPLPVARLWGVGPKTAERLIELGIATIGDLAATDRRLLEREFGQHGGHLHDLANGKDERSVEPDHDAKSYSHEVTYATDQVDRDVLDSTLLDQAARVARRMRRDGVRGRTVVVKLRDFAFRTITRRHTFTFATDDPVVIHRAAARLLDESWDGRPIRLIGSGVANIVTEEEPLSLFGSEEREDKRRKLESVIDELQDRFGRAKFVRAGAMRSRTTRDTGSSLKKDT